MSKRELIETRAFAARLKDKQALHESSSGGAFTALSDYVLAQGGAIACSVYNYETDKMEFRLFTDTYMRDKARGSKYVQSIPGNIFKECEQWVKSNPEKKLLFVGMGCQAAGFKAYAEMNRFADKVYVVDIICHGSPSPKVWDDYVKMLEKMYNGSMDYVTFKDKRNGWKNPVAYARISGKEVRLKPYSKIFMSGMNLRPSCHKCPYAATERTTDMTIGDFWGIEKTMPDFYNEMGNSLMLLHTNIGQELFEQINNDMDYRECTVEECLQPNLVKPSAKSDRREEFWRDYQSGGVEFLVKKYGTDSFMTKVIRKIKYLLKVR